ncbi:outer membrane beta-barrel protein [Aurantivibrio plasticivorans]
MIKTFTLTSLSIATLLLSSQLAFAEGGFYLGAKTGNLDIDASSFDAETPLGIMAGYEFDGGFAIQFETISSDLDVNTFGGSGDFDSYALYGVYRGPSSVYFMAKAGILYEDIEVPSSFYPGSINVSDEGLSAGFGLGFRPGNHALIEFEYTIIEEDVNFIGASLAVQF